MLLSVFVPSNITKTNVAKIDNNIKYYSTVAQEVQYIYISLSTKKDISNM